MNLEEIRKKLNSLNKPKGGNNSEKREKIDYSLYLWKPKTVGKHVIRIVNSKSNPENPFKEVFVHYGYGKFPIYALTNWGEKDPIVEFTKSLRTGEYDIENWKLASKLEPKMRIFAPVIVRGEEDKGVRLWEFGKEVYAQLLAMADDEDYGDYTDVNEGFDFTLDAVEGDVGGRKGIKYTLRVKPKKSKLSNDPAEVEKWLTEQPDILDFQSRFKFTFEKLKETLANFLTPSDTETSEAPFVEETEDEAPKAKSTPKSSKKNKADEFDALFNETK